MEFIETPTFTRQVVSLLSDDEYLQLQIKLVADPEQGDLIRGGGGIRKIRFTTQGHGKRGGARIIYYWIKEEHQIYMLSAYSKSRKDDLSAKEIEVLHDFVKEL